MASKYIFLKKRSAFLAIRKMQIKTTLRFHLTPDVIRKSKNQQVLVRLQGKPLPGVDGDVNYCSHYGNLNRASQKPKNRSSI